MTVARVLIEYGFTPDDKYRHIMWFSTGDTSDKLGGNDADTAEAHGAPASFGDVNAYVTAYLIAARQVVASGVHLITASAEQWSDGPDRVVIHSQTYNAPTWGARTGASGLGGPRGRSFFGHRQIVAGSRRPGWLRFHYIDRTLQDNPTTFPASTISALYGDTIEGLRNPVTGISGYLTVTNTLSLAPQLVVKTVPELTCHQGVRNG
jgi:hypothetical protein